ncbi:MAG: hypothetical protein ACR2QU_00505, partial [Gammaproteobacteria bacterium]
QAARSLPDDLPPDRDLWPRIEARIQGGVETSPRNRGRWMLGGALAAGLALVAMSSLVTSWLMDEPAPIIVRQAPLHDGAALAARTATFGSDYVLGPKYETARNDLASDLDAQMEALTPETREVVQRSLSQIRRAMDEINKELAADPNNVLLQRLLMTTYQDEMAVLMNVNRMMQTLPTRTEI